MKQNAAFLLVLSFIFTFNTNLNYALGYVAPVIPVASVSIILPNGGEDIKTGETTIIAWAANNVKSTDWFRIFLVRPGTGLGEKDITFASYRDRSYYWTVPANLGAYNDYKIRIKLCKGLVNGGDLECTFGGIAQDDSDGTFSISRPQVIHTSPSRQGRFKLAR